MGLLFGKPANRMNPSTPKAILTPEEKEHLMLLGTTAGGPGIIDDAIKSGSIFDPTHLERAQRLNRQWDEGVAFLAPYMKRLEKIEAERAQLREMGLKMEGQPKSSTYDHIEAQIGNVGLPTSDWVLRIEASADNYVDMQLASYPDYIADCLIDACRVVPRFNAVLHRPDMEPAVIFSHPVVSE